MSSISESFGFLKYPNSIVFDGGLIQPTDLFHKNLEDIEKIENRDGYIYPPQVTSSIQRYDFESGEFEESQLVPNSTKPSSVFELPASHILHIENPLDSQNIRFEDAGLLIHLLGFIFGTRLQFSAWRFDGRVPTKYKNYLFYSSDTLSHFISFVYAKWKTLKPEQRKYYINILYMHGKAKSCIWEWDEFLYQYMVFDAIYRFYVMLGNNEIKGGHKKRLFSLCDYFNIQKDSDRLNEIYNLRNNLFHEALWYGDMIGFNKNNKNSHRIPKCLERLNSQLIVAVIGYQNNYSKSASWFNLSFRGDDFDIFKN